MTIPRTKTWSFGEKVTFGQLNQLDTNPTYALDKRSGQTDSLQSVVSCSGAGRIVPSYVTGTDANTSYAITGGNSFIDVSTLTGSRTYTLLTAGAVAGDTITVAVRAAGFSTLLIKDGSGTSLATLATNLATYAPWAEFLYNGTAWVLACSGPILAPVFNNTPFATSGTFTCPASGPTSFLVMAWGGGGGGGAGMAGTTASANSTSGGGGGGAALRTFGEVQLTAGVAYAITVGPGGSGGPTAGAYGIAGNDTTIAPSASPSAFIFRAYGAHGGTGAYLTTNSTTIGKLVRGGQSSRFAQQIAFENTVESSDANILALVHRKMPGEGGAGVHPGYYAGTYSGAPSADAVGGSGGVAGALSGAYYGGGAGGGGAGGNFDQLAGNDPTGGTGGDGGVGNSAGSGGAGVAGGSALANTGAGGGGGGSGGQGSSGAGTFRAGGTGGSGFLVLIPIH